MNKRDDIVNEMLFNSLAGHAMNNIKIVTRDNNPIVYSITSQTLNYFKNNKKAAYTSTFAMSLKTYLKKALEPVLTDTSPVVFIIITLDYLLQVGEHKETMKYFNKYHKQLSDMITELELSDNRTLMFEHHKKLLKAVTTNVED